MSVLKIWKKWSWNPVYAVSSYSWLASTLISHTKLDSAAVLGHWSHTTTPTSHLAFLFACFMPFVSLLMWLLKADRVCCTNWGQRKGLWLNQPQNRRTFIGVLRFHHVLATTENHNSVILDLVKCADNKVSLLSVLQLFFDPAPLSVAMTLFPSFTGTLRSLFCQSWWSKSKWCTLFKVKTRVELTFSSVLIHKVTQRSLIK